MIYIITSTWQIPNKDQLNSSMSTAIFRRERVKKISKKTWAWHRSSLHVDHMPNLWGLTVHKTMGKPVTTRPCLKDPNRKNPKIHGKSTLRPMVWRQNRPTQGGGQHKQQDNHGINMNNFLHMLFTMFFFFAFVFCFRIPLTRFFLLNVFWSQKTNKNQTPKSIGKKKYQGFTHKVLPPGRKHQKNTRSWLLFSPSL